ncbi:MAG: transcriptional regulator [Chloroflexota bacterium]
MSTPFEAIANLDKLVHEPARLAVLTALSACESADFIFLRRLTGLSNGNLSIQVSKLEEAGLVTVQKQIVNKRSNTNISITERGADVTRQYWEQINALKQNAEAWKDGQGG